MDSTNGNDNGDRSSRRSHSVRLSTGVASTHDDDYDLSAMAVADGFRPSGNSYAPQPESSNQDPPSQLNHSTGFGTSNHVSEFESPGMRIRPSSISKPPPSHDSLTLRNEGSSNTSAPSSQTGFTSQTDDLVLRAESPYQGPSGPSHPYEMYPQRTMSVATTSTAANAVIPDDRAYPNSRGPTHPYTLYTQNVSSGETSDASIPVGFNTHGATYQRQIGPDGEEAGDLIGPLGHMEELPPYTRYPDNAYVPKVTTEPSTTQSPATQTPISEPASPVQASNLSTNPPIAGAGGIGMATRDPEFSSTDDDLALPRTRPSVRSTTSDNSWHDINTAATDVAEKPPQNKWQRRAKKKLWGIVPYWAICLVTVGLVLMGIIMGAVIGTLLSRHKGPPPPPHPTEDESTESTTTVQITPLSTYPPDLPDLVTGYYILPSFKMTQGPDSCLNDSTQSNAWSCEMPSSQFKIKVSKEDVAFTVYLTPNNYFKLRYGAQPPSFVQPETLILVNDSLEPSRGPGWWYRAAYNKTVLVTEDYFKTKKKRGWDQDDDGPYSYYDYPAPGRFGKDFSHVKDGQKPWLCTFYNTRLDIFLYPDQSVNTGFTATTTSETYKATSTPGATEYPKPLPAYPQVFKMMERRYYDSRKDRASTCRQVEIYDSGSKYKFLSSKGEDEVRLVENESPWPENDVEIPTSKSKRWVHELFPRTSEELTDCSCIWLAT